MTTSHTSSDPDDSFEEQLHAFLERSFPQIPMHGGEAAILAADPDAGHVELQLGGACTGCGLSPMTIAALQSRITDEFPEVDSVEVSTGLDGDGLPLNYGRR